MEKVKADLHNHLRTSSVVREGDFNRAIDLAYKRLGPGGIFGMVNFADQRYEEFSNLKGYERVYLGKNKNGFYVPEKDIFVVKGEEIPTKQGHLLVLGLDYDKHLKHHDSLEDTIKAAKDNNGITVIDHPFYVEGMSKHLEKNLHLLEDLDAIEVHNGEAAFGLPFGLIPKNANLKALEFYKRIEDIFPDVGALSSSDGHSMYELGSSWTKIDKPYIHNFISTLKKSINETDISENRKDKNSILGAVDHIIDLIYLAKIAPKIGLKTKFENLKNQ